MKLVAPADLKGPHCVDHKARMQCRHMLPSVAYSLRCGLYERTVRCVINSAKTGEAGMPKKCSACVDALTELEDR